MLYWHDTWEIISFELREARSTELRDQRLVTRAGTHLPLETGHRAESMYVMPPASVWSNHSRMLLQSSGQHLCLLDPNKAIWVDAIAA